MKPRISRHRPSAFFRECQWKCIGDGLMGIGSSPQWAYWDWRHWFDKKQKTAASRGVEIDQREPA